MNTLALLAVPLALLPTLAAAGPRPVENYQCSGRNGPAPISFRVINTDYSRGIGFAYQAVEITSENGRPLAQPILLNRHASQDCTEFEGMVSLTQFTAQPNGSGVDVAFRLDCGPGLRFQVRASCERLP